MPSHFELRIKVRALYTRTDTGKHISAVECLRGQSVAAHQSPVGRMYKRDNVAALWRGGVEGGDGRRASAGWSSLPLPSFIMRPEGKQVGLVPSRGTSDSFGHGSSPDLAIGQCL